MRGVSPEEGEKHTPSAHIERHACTQRAGICPSGRAFRHLANERMRATIPPLINPDSVISLISNLQSEFQMASSNMSEAVVVGGGWPGGG